MRTDLVNEISKNMLSEETLQKTCDLFKILGDVNRIRILLAIQYSELCVCELSLLLDMSQSSVSHQLRHLRNKNLVKFRKENKQIFYSLVDEEIIKLIKKGEENAN
nr:metalloregulator ArsR/SmtB family transcription factor [Methanobrevibacter woesei]